MLIGYEVVAVAAGTEVNPGVGALDLAGFAPTVQVSDNKVVFPGLGELTLSGFAPSLDIGIGAATGTLSLTGFEPTALTPRTVNADVGAAVLSGFAPTINIGVNAQPGTGDLTLAAFSPTVQATQHVTLSSGVGLLSIEGFAPDIVLPQPPPARGYFRVIRSRRRSPLN